MIMKHVLSSPPENFEFIWSGEKTSDWRKYRNYKVGDLLDILEYDIETRNYSGRCAVCQITHIQIEPKLKMPDGWCILNFIVVERKIATSATLRKLAEIGFKDNVLPKPKQNQIPVYSSDSLKKDKMKDKILLFPK